MMRSVTRRFMTIATSVLLSVCTIAQPVDEPAKKPAKPYQVLTSGKQVTVKSIKNIKSIMVWTASGHRIVEQRNLNTSLYSFAITVNERIFYLMIQYEGLKPFTEKIGIR